MKRATPILALGDVLEIRKDRIEPLETPERLFHYLGLEHIESHTGRILNVSPTRGDEIRSTKNVFSPGNVLFGKLRPNLNKVHLADREGICSTDIFVIEVDTTKVLPGYAAYYLRSPRVLGRVTERMEGANLPRINQGAFLSIMIPLPALADQRRIVALLDAADELRRLRAAADRRTANLIPALFHEMFGDPATNPKGWPVLAVEQIAKDGRRGVTTGPFGTQLGTRDFVSTGLEVFGVYSIDQAGEFRSGGTKRISPEKFRELARFDVRPDDVLISRMGTVGKVCMVPNGASSGIVSYHLIRVRLNHEHCIPQYFSQLLSVSERGQIGLSGQAKGAIMSGINAGIVASFQIPVPPLSLQREFALHLAHVRSIQESQACSRRRLDDLFQSLLHRAFQGELA